MALTLVPEGALAEWLADLDSLLRRAPGFFVGRAVILDISKLPLASAAVTSLVADLLARDIRVLGIEGAASSTLEPGMPPPLTGGRPVGGEIVQPDRGLLERSPLAEQAKSQPASLILEAPVRSGQSIVFPDGDVTVIGSIGSGAEVVAGGSIHVYGALRGRALAGATGNSAARIFCRKLEAELLSIDGIYKVADDIAAELHGRAVQAWLDEDAVQFAVLD